MKNQNTTGRRHGCVSTDLGHCALCPAEDTADRQAAREVAVSAILAKPIRMWSATERATVATERAFTVLLKWSRARQRGQRATATVAVVVASGTVKGGWAVEKGAERLQARLGSLLTLGQASDLARSAERATSAPRRQRA